MKLYRISWPWDYHKQATLVVMAESEEQAVHRVKAYIKVNYLPNNFNVRNVPIAYENIVEIDGPVYEDEGCDC